MSPRCAMRMAVQLHRVGDVPPAVGAALVVPEGPDAGDEDVLDLVFPGTLEHERLLQAGGEVDPAVPRRNAFRAWQRVIVRVAVGDDVAGDAAPGRSDDRPGTRPRRRRRPGP